MATNVSSMLCVCTMNCSLQGNLMIGITLLHIYGVALVVAILIYFLVHFYYHNKKNAEEIHTLKILLKEEQTTALRERRSYRTVVVRLYGFPTTDKNLVFLTRVLVGQGCIGSELSSDLMPYIESGRDIICVHAKDVPDNLLGAPEWRLVPKTPYVIILGERYILRDEFISQSFGFYD